MSTVNTQTLLQATFAATVAVRNETDSALSLMGLHAIAGFGSIPNDRLRVIEQHVADADHITREIIMGLSSTDRAKAFIEKWAPRYREVEEVSL